MENTTPQSSAQLSRLRVLVLDDVPSQRALVTGILRAFGIENVTQAEDGASGLRALTDSVDGFDIAICDLKMEGMDGIEFIRHASQQNIAGFILLSVLEEEILVSAGALARRYGANLLGVLSKPVDFQRLEQLLTRYAKSNASAPRVAPTQPQFGKDDLIEALNRQEFIPFFQPKINLDTNLPTGVEILARWNHPRLGILPPSMFVELMERTGLIDWLSDSLFRQALDCAQQWSARGWNIDLAINVSPLTLQKTYMPNHILAIVKEHGISPDQITIEVTETAVSQKPDGLLETLVRLRVQGFKLSVDDFGTGYSSLLQLSEMPFTEIKIDRTFVAGIFNNKKSTTILESIVLLADKLGMRTVAEGIETKGELDFIRSLNCREGQGFYLVKPMPHEDLMRYFEGDSGWSNILKR